MKTGEAAALLGVSINTARNWLDRQELTHLFSEGAKGTHGGAQRVLSETDVLVLNTVRHLRNVDNVTEWPDIVRQLDADYRVQEFPQNAISADPRVIPLPQAEQSARAAATLAQRDEALVRVNELETEIERLRDELKTERDKHREDIERLLKESNQDKQELNERVAQLQRELGRAEAKLEILQERDNNT